MLQPKIGHNLALYMKTFIMDILYIKGIYDVHVYS